MFTVAAPAVAFTLVAPVAADNPTRMLPGMVAPAAPVDAEWEAYLAYFEAHESELSAEAELANDWDDYCRSQSCDF